MLVSSQGLGRLAGLTPAIPARRLRAGRGQPPPDEPEPEAGAADPECRIRWPTRVSPELFRGVWPDVTKCRKRSFQNLGGRGSVMVLSHVLWIIPLLGLVFGLVCVTVTASAWAVIESPGRPAF